MKGFKYKSLADLMSVIRNNITKIPHDIDFVIGIPRSGMIVASVISEMINVPLIDLDSFVKGQKPTGGHRLKLFADKKTDRVLVVDDTCYSGKAINEAKNQLRDFKEYDFIYCIAFLEGLHPEMVDIWLDDVSNYTKKDIQVIYEWNIFHHYPYIMLKFCFDMDGVFCTEESRPDDRYESDYELFIKFAKPLFTPKVPIGAIVTYRITKYKDVTEYWLKENGIVYQNLIMFNARSWQERNGSGVSPEMMKAVWYKEHPEYLLFIESNDREAQRIHEISGKQVFCVSTNKMYGDF